MSDEVPGVPGRADPIPGNPGPARAGDLLSIALAALAALAELGETIEDEWSYVTKLAEMGRARIQAVVPDPDTLVPAEAAAAIEALADEVGRITDPHRAIDWMSTLPAVAELAFGAGRAAVPPAPQAAVSPVPPPVGA